MIGIDHRHIVADMKKSQNMQGFSATVIIVIGVTVILVASATVWFFRRDENKSAQQNQPSTTISEDVIDNTQAPEPETFTKYSSDTFGYTIQIPSSWTEQQTPESIIYTGVSKSENIQIQLAISKDTTLALSCPQVPKDSEDLTYTNPLPGQRKVTKLSFASIETGSKSLCGVMITGSYSLKKGSVIPINDPAFQAALPTNRISAYISTAESTTNYPALDKALSSKIYAQLLESLRSLQVQ